MPVASAIRFRSLPADHTPIYTVDTDRWAGTPQRSSRTRRSKTPFFVLTRIHFQPRLVRKRQHQFARLLCKRVSHCGTKQLNEIMWFLRLPSRHWLRPIEYTFVVSATKDESSRDRDDRLVLIGAFEDDFGRVLEAESNLGNCITDDRQDRMPAARSEFPGHFMPSSTCLRSAIPVFLRARHHRFNVLSFTTHSLVPLCLRGPVPATLVEHVRQVCCAARRRLRRRCSWSGRKGLLRRA